jgi:microcin C transport system substrate-binding protein
LAITRRHLLQSAAFATDRPGAGSRNRPFGSEPGEGADATGEPAWRHGLSLFGDIKYPADFKRFDYVNPDAPKGGVARQISIGTFDNFNIAVAGIKGSIAPAAGLIYETLMARSQDESSDRVWIAGGGRLAS